MPGTERGLCGPQLQRRGPDLNSPNLHSEHSHTYLARKGVYVDLNSRGGVQTSTLLTKWACPRHARAPDWNCRHPHTCLARKGVYVDLNSRRGVQTSTLLARWLETNVAATTTAAAIQHRSESPSIDYPYTGMHRIHLPHHVRSTGFWAVIIVQ